LLGATRNNDDMLLSWSTVGGHSYVVQSLTGSNQGLSGSFLDLSPPIAVGGTNEGLTNYQHVGGATNVDAYYRVRLGP